MTAVEQLPDYFPNVRTCKKANLWVYVFVTEHGSRFIQGGLFHVLC